MHAITVHLRLKIVLHVWPQLMMILPFMWISGHITTISSCSVSFLCFRLRQSPAEMHPAVECHKTPAHQGPFPTLAVRLRSPGGGAGSLSTPRPHWSRTGTAGSGPLRLLFRSLIKGGRSGSGWHGAGRHLGLFGYPRRGSEFQCGGHPHYSSVGNWLGA